MASSELNRQMYDAYCLAAEYRDAYQALRETFKTSPDLTGVFGYALLNDCYRKWSHQLDRYEWLACRVAFLHPC